MRVRSCLVITSLVAAAIGIVGLARAEDPDLAILDYTSFQAPGNFPAYLERYGRMPTAIPFGSEDEAFKMVKDGAVADAVGICGGSVNKWEAAGLLAPINTGRLAEWPKVQPTLRDAAFLRRDNQQLLVPVYWGNVGLIYRTDLVSKEDAASLTVFADPRFKGKVAIADNIDDVFALAFMVVGRRDGSAPFSEEEISKATEFLRRVHANGAIYWLDPDQLAAQLQSGEVALAWAWNETATRLAGEGRPVVMNMAPREGTSTWICGYARLADGIGSDDKLYEFLDAVLSDRASRYQLNVNGYFPTNLTGFTKADIETLRNMGLENYDELLANSLVQTSYPADLRARLEAEFEAIKAGK